MSSAPITTTIVATAASPRNMPSRASARAKQTVNAPSASAAPMPNAGPPAPAANPAPKAQASPSAAMSAVIVSRPHHAQSSTAAATAMSGHIDEAPASARPNADGPPPAAQGAMKSA